MEVRKVLSEFGVVRPHRTSLNHCDAGEMQREAGLRGGFERVRGGSTRLNLEPL